MVYERPYNFFLADIRLPFDINVIDPAKEEDKEMRLLAEWNVKDKKKQKKNYWTRRDRKNSKNDVSSRFLMPVFLFFRIGLCQSFALIRNHLSNFITLRSLLLTFIECKPFR